jgi:cytochrome P450 family 4
LVHLETYCTIEHLQDLPFLNNVINEALRFQAPVHNTTKMELSEDCSIKGTDSTFNLRKGAAIYIDILGLHFNATEWQRPHEFLTDRFDTESPLYKRPDGKKRNPFSFLPFSAGRRVCFGKTFAEQVLKYTITYLTQHFDFEFCEPEKYKDSYPFAVIMQSNIEPINVKFSKRQD